jgi:hypothetical protein
LNCEQTNSHPWDGYALAIWSMAQTTWSFLCEKNTWIATPCLPRVWERVRQKHATTVTDLRYRVAGCFGAWCFGERFGARCFGVWKCENVTANGITALCQLWLESWTGNALLERKLTPGLTNAKPIKPVD